MKKNILTIGALFAALLIAGAGCTGEEDRTIPPPTSTEEPTTTTPVPEPSTTTTGTPLGTPSGNKTDPNKNLAENITQITDTFVFLAAIQDAGMTEVLNQAGPYTIFAPSNDAFNTLPSSTIKSLLGKENRENLQRLLKFHIVKGSYNTDSLTDNQKLKTENGEELIVRKMDGEITINQGSILTEDMNSKNGIIHVISKVNIPKNFKVKK